MHRWQKIFSVCNADIAHACNNTGSIKITTALQLKDSPDDDHGCVTAQLGRVVACMLKGDDMHRQRCTPPASTTCKPALICRVA